jgi:hypothetical protein
MRQSVAGISAEARRLSDRYDALGAQATSGVGELTQTARQLGTDLTRLAQRADTLLNATDAELRQTMRELRAASDAVEVAARRLSDPRSALFGPSAASLGPGESKQ